MPCAIRDLCSRAPGGPAKPRTDVLRACLLSRRSLALDWDAPLPLAPTARGVSEIKTASCAIFVPR